MSKTLQKLRKDPRVSYIDDERSIGNSIIITLFDHDFNTDPYNRIHVLGVDNVKAAVYAVRDSVLCHCPICLNNRAKGKASFPGTRS